MTDAVLMNVVQQKANDYSKLKQNRRSTAEKGDFAKTLENINRNNSKKQSRIDSSAEKSKSTKEKITDDEFLDKLEKIISKNKDEIPSELLSLLNSGSLNDQQTAMLEKIMINLKNNNLNITQLKTILEQNNDAINLENFNTANSDSKLNTLSEINSGKLSQIASALEADETLLSKAEKEIVAKEINYIADFLLNRGEAVEQNTKNTLKGILASNDLANKMVKLGDLIDSNAFSELNLDKKISDSSLLKKIMSSTATDFSSLDNVNSKEKVLYAELAAQLNEMISDKNPKNLNNSQLKEANIFSLFSGESSNVAVTNNSNADREGSFFNLSDENSYLNFNFNDNNQTVNQQSLSLNNNTSSDLRNEMNIEAQVVEQFKGEYSSETKEMQIQLKPESLGKIDITLAYDNDKLTGKMLVENEIVRAQLENSLSNLKSDLVRQGINIDQFKIETAKNSPQQVDNQDNFSFNDENAAFSDGETGHNQEFEQRQFFQGQYYVKNNNSELNVDSDNLIMKQQDILNRAAFSNDSINLLA